MIQNCQSRLHPLLRHWKWILPVAIGLGLRVVYWCQYSASPLFPTALGPDIAEYDARAREILSGFYLPQELDIHGPLYSFFLAFLYRIVCFSIPAVRLLQLLLNWSAWCFLVWCMVCRGGFPVKICRFFLWISMIVTTPFFYQAELVSESLLLPLLFVVFFFLFEADSQKDDPMCALFSGGGGIFAGLAAVTHPMTLLFAGLEALWMFARTPRRVAAAFVIGAVLPILAVSGFNSAIAGRPVLIQGNSAFNLWLGNNPAATGGCYIRPGAEWLQTHRNAEKIAAEQGISAERYFLNEIADFWIYSPLQAIGLTLKKACLVFSVRELPAGADSDFLVRRTPLQRLGGFLTLPLFLFCGWGIAVCFRKKLLCYHHFYLLFSAGFLAQVITVTSGRYRMEMMPAVFLLAAIGIDSIDWRRHWETVVPACLLASWIATPVPEASREQAAEAGALYAEAALQRGDLHAAKRHLELPLRLKKDPARLGNMLGIAEWNLGHLAVAETQFRQVMEAAPEDYEAFMNLAVLLAEQPERQTEAQEAFAAAFGKFPDVADLHYNFGHVLQSQERWQEAEKSYLRAVGLQRLHQPALIGLGIVAMHAGRPQDAVKWFERALAITPDDNRLLLNLAIACRAAGDEFRARQLEQRADYLQR